MTKPISAAEQGLKSHYKVRVVVSGAILHLASWTEPEISHSWGTVNDQKVYEVEGEGLRVMAGWINDHQYGDTLGYIDWREVSAITWRWSE